MKDPKVSIIIPIYNGEKYLEECVDTVLSQSYQNIEVILVDDGSEDHSADICQRYVDQDMRCRFIQQENKGASAARQTGALAANGQYIFFVDCDDWLDGDAVEKLAKSAYEHNADLVVLGYRNECGTGEIIEKYGKLDAGVYDTEKMPEFYDSMFYLGAGSGWGILPNIPKLFRREILLQCMNQIDERIFYGEDAALVFTVCFMAKKVVVLKEAFYHYRTTSTTSISRKRNKALLDNMYYLYEYLYSLFIKQGNKELLLRQLGYYMISLMNHAGKLLFDIPYSLQDTEWMRPAMQDMKDKHMQLLADYYKLLFSSESGKVKVILYGAGKLGTIYYQRLSELKNVEIIAWADKNWRSKENLIGIEDIKSYDFDYILISVLNDQTREAIASELLEHGIALQKIRGTEVS